jgi:circadian clock protein KaiC
MDRVKTGIAGLDELMDGGIPKNNVVLLSGLTGSGKTILALQYLVKGVELYNEKGLFVTFEQSKEDVISQASQLGWDLVDLENKNMFKILALAPSKTQFVNVIKIIEDSVGSFSPSRLVLDSISTYGLYAETLKQMEIMQMMGIDSDKFQFITTPEVATRHAIIDMIECIKDLKLTSLVVSELPEETAFLSRDTMSEFLSDGVILLKHVSMGDNLNRSIEVRKMRRTSIRGGPRSYEITGTGIVIEG